MAAEPITAAVEHADGCPAGDGSWLDRFHGSRLDASGWPEQTRTTRCNACGAQVVEVEPADVDEATERDLEIDALKGLERVECESREADSALAEARVKARSAGREVTRVESALRDLYAQADLAGRKPDAKRERQLRDEVAAVRARVSTRQIVESGRERTVIVDQLLEGRVQAAEERAQDAQDEVGQFVRRNRRRLIEALVADAVDAGSRAFDAYAALGAASARWSAVAGVWRRLGPQWGLADTLPPNPFGDLSDRGVLARKAAGHPLDDGLLRPMPQILDESGQRRRDLAPRLRPNDGVMRQAPARR